MKALVLREGSPYEAKLEDFPQAPISAGEVLIQMKAAALNHRDQWMREGLYPQITCPSILGSDGCGLVVEQSPDVAEDWVGKTVVINPNVHWGDNPAYPDYNYTILGMPKHGTLSEYLVVPADRIHLKPEHLSDEQAAALPLAGLTAYRALFTKGQLQSGQKVFITGIGGGVAQFALLFAHSVGAEVYVNSGSPEKIQKAESMGAKAGFNYRKENWYKGLRKVAPLGFDVIIDGAGGPDFSRLAQSLGMDGRMVVYGTTAGKPSPIHLPRLFFSQASIIGTTMGNDAEFEAMLQLVNKNKIIPGISSVRPFDQVIESLDEMKSGTQMGKLVLKF